jgi:hypothetical protein
LPDPENSPELTAVVNAIESLVLAHTSARVDAPDPAYLAGLETAIETNFEVHY